MADSYFIREKKDRDYTVLCNHFLKNDQLSWKAKGVMAYLLSLPDDWQIHKVEIQRHATDGRDSLTAAINELKDAGYITIEKQGKSPNGQFASVVYIVREIPLTGNPSTVKPLTENPKLQNTDTLNTNKLNLLSSEENELNKEEEKVEEKIPPIPSVKSARELEMEKSFDEALGITSSSPLTPSTTKKKSNKRKNVKSGNKTTTCVESDDFYKPIYEAYRSAFFNIYPAGTIPNCGKYKSFVDSCLKRYSDLDFSHEQIRDMIISAIDSATHDDYIIKNRFPFAMITSESVMPRLINTTSSKDAPQVGVDFDSQQYGGF